MAWRFSFAVAALAEPTNRPCSVAALTFAQTSSACDNVTAKFSWMVLHARLDCSGTPYLRLSSLWPAGVCPSAGNRARPELGNHRRSIGNGHQRCDLSTTVRANLAFGRVFDSVSADR